MPPVKSSTGFSPNCSAIPPPLQTPNFSLISLSVSRNDIHSDGSSAVSHCLDLPKAPRANQKGQRDSLEIKGKTGIVLLDEYAGSSLDGFRPDATLLEGKRPVRGKSMDEKSR
jgi:hypothetical protein